MRQTFNSVAASIRLLTGEIKPPAALRRFHVGPEGVVAAKQELGRIHYPESGASTN